MRKLSPTTWAARNSRMQQISWSLRICVLNGTIWNIISKNNVLTAVITKITLSDVPDWYERLPCCRITLVSTTIKQNHLVRTTIRRTRRETPCGLSSSRALSVPWWCGRGATWRPMLCPSHGGVDEGIPSYGGADKGDVAAQESFVPSRNSEERYFWNCGCEDVIFANVASNSVI